MKYDVFKRVEELISCTSVQALTNTFARHMCYYGFDQYALAFTSANQQPGDMPVVIATYDKAWVDHYFANKYDEIDPVFLTTKAQTEPFLWNDIWTGMELDKAQTNFFNEAKDYGIAYGLGMPISVFGRENALLSLVSSACKPREVEQIASEYVTEIALLTNYFHQIADALSQKEKKQTDIKKILTEREKEILLWIARGKADADMGLILGISVYTVREHVRSLCKKLNVTTRSQACAIGIINGIIKNVFGMLALVSCVL